MGLFHKPDSVTKCKKCGTELNEPERLKRHEQIAHNSKSLEKCRVCGSEFHTSDELRKHKKKCK